MPVDWSRCPPDWKAIVARVAERAGGRCECRGECGTPSCAGGCGAVQREPHPVTGSRVVLTTAHLDHDTTHNDMSNLRHLCQRCHLRLDSEHHRRNATRTRLRRREEAGQMSLPGTDPSLDAGKVTP